MFGEKNDKYRRKNKGNLYTIPPLFLHIPFFIIDTHIFFFSLVESLQLSSVNVSICYIVDFQFFTILAFLTALAFFIKVI